MTRLLLATRNDKKLEELHRILRIWDDIEIVGLSDVPAYEEPAETEPTFEGNASLKARAAVAATGLPSLADDSGICVDALNGMPGVMSARWSGAGQDEARNNELLLAQLRDVPDERLGAHFTCAVALCLPAGEEHIVTGTMPGTVIRELRGTGGFGYDALFVPAGQAHTSAEMPAEQKDEISHRGQALRAMAPVVVAALRGAGE